MSRWELTIKNISIHHQWFDSMMFGCLNGSKWSVVFVLQIEIEMKWNWKIKNTKENLIDNVFSSYTYILDIYLRWDDDRIFIFKDDVDVLMLMMMMMWIVRWISLVALIKEKKNQLNINSIKREEDATTTNDWIKMTWHDFWNRTEQIIKEWFRIGFTLISIKSIDNS